MYSSENRRILFTTIFAVVVSLTATTLVITTGVTLMLTPAFAQLSENLVSCTEVTDADFINEADGNMATGPFKQSINCIDENGIPRTLTFGENPYDMTGSGMAQGENTSEGVMEYVDPNGIPPTETPLLPGGSTTTGEDREKFREFMDCLNAAGLMHPEDIIPTAGDVTSCYDPIYGSGAGDWTSGGASEKPIPGSLLTDEEISGTAEFFEGLEEGNMTGSDTTGSGMAEGGYYDENGRFITTNEQGIPARICP